MYNQAAKNKELADAIVDAIIDYDKDLILMALSGSQMIKSAKEKKIKYASEVFADRAYEADGSLRARSLENSMITDEIWLLKGLLKWCKQEKLLPTRARKLILRRTLFVFTATAKKRLYLLKS